MLILLPDGGESYTGGSLLVHKLPEAALTLDDAIWHLFLSAKLRQPANELNRVNIMRNDN